MVQEIINDMEQWTKGSKLGCPYLRDYGGKWIALDKDPCPDGKCGNRCCHNFKKKFEEMDKLIIIKRSLNS